MLHDVPVFPTMFKNRYILGYPDSAIQQAARCPTFPPFFELVCHGGRYEHGKTFASPFVKEGIREKKLLNAEQLFEIIATHPAYTFGQPVRLLICHAGYGPNSLAQQLADLLGAPVMAADTGIYVETLLPEENGHWIVFTPRHQ